MDAAQAVTSEMLDEEGRLLTQRSEQVRTSSRRTLTLIASFALIALGIIAVASWHIDKGNRQRQRDHERISILNVELEVRTQKLTESNKELEAFTYSVSHDLRAPLRHIDGFSKMLVESNGERLSDEGREYLTLIRDSTREMGQLVDDLLGLARIGRANLTVQLTGLDSIVEGVVSDLKRANNERALEWKIEKLPFVECDAGLMRQVFTNFLSNAVKFTRPREPAIIHVGTTKHAGSPVIFVRDNGVGFNIKHADKLFGVFQRLHRQEDFEGTGVGLATVQRIIQKHGGRVWAEAAVDQGATFYFTLGSAAPAGPTNRSSEVTLEA
jgi:light-regulated signal transduction histidine kinase (bacteriophytochrome)